MAIRIVIDSTADLAPGREIHFTVIPMTVRFGQEEFVQGVTLSNTQFYEKLADCRELPTTSQATPYQFETAFREAIEAGDQVLVITLSAKLSGTYQSAMAAAAEFPGQVFVVDSTSVAIGTGILAELALQLVRSGMSAAEIAAELTVQRENICIIAMLDTLEYLKKGGRISSAVALAGGLLGIKPVVGMKDGGVAILGKARGSKQGNNMLVQQIHAVGGVNFEKPLLLGYTGLSDALLRQYIRDSAALWEENTDSLPSTLIGSVVGTHVGPGAVAVAFFKR